MLYLSDYQVAERYGAHRGTVWRWVREGIFPEPVRFSPGCTRWPLSEIEDWEKKRLEQRKVC